MREGLGLAVLGGLDVPVSARLSPLLADALAGLEADRVDVAYVRSAAFRANVIQANRAAEIAESDGKLALIARALAGCARLHPPHPGPLPGPADRGGPVRAGDGRAGRGIRPARSHRAVRGRAALRGSVPLGWSRLEFEGRWVDWRAWAC